jgi:pyruvate dehydrogenase E2 component (dihydrolipoamide acetyltransferase)
VGDAVVAGETLLEVETEKSVVEIEAAASGRLAEILVPAESPATVGDQVGWIESVDSAGQGASTPAPKVPVAPAPADAPAPKKPVPTEPAASSSPQATPHEGGRIRSTPAARSLAAEHGIDLGSITGTGPGGRIQLDDVRHVIDRPRAGGTATSTLAPMRRALARAMTRSVATIPQFTVSRSVDWTVLQSLRSEHLERTPAGSPRLSVTDFLLQAVARALMEFPSLNATFSGDPDDPDASLVPAFGAHIGLVVAVDNGLLVPVMHDVERLDLNEIARRRADCVERALKGRLKREESEGATFSISNLGADGPDRFTAIINPPQSAILAVGRQRDAVTAIDGAPAVRPMSDLTLTVDHRVADGRLAAQYLTRLVAILEGRDWQI